MQKDVENFVERETRLRAVEKEIENFHSKLNQLEDKMESRFMIIMGIIFTSIIIPVILHELNLG